MKGIITFLPYDLAFKNFISFLNTVYYQVIPTQMAVDEKYEEYDTSNPPLRHLCRRPCNYSGPARHSWRPCTYVPWPRQGIQTHGASSPSSRTLPGSQPSTAGPRGHGSAGTGTPGSLRGWPSYRACLCGSLRSGNIVPGNDTGLTQCGLLSSRLIHLFQDATSRSYLGCAAD